MTISIALLFQYLLAPKIMDPKGWLKAFQHMPGFGKQIFKAWTDGCDRYDTDTQYALKEQCIGNNGVYRPTFVASIFFLISAMATKCNPALNREAWPAKYAIYLLLVFAFMFVPNTPLFDGIYLYLHRIGAMLFVVLEQIILIDVAYNWNENWVEKSNEADRVEYYGAGTKWLRAIIAMCVLMYVLSFTGIGLLYHFYLGCAINNVIISLTLVGILAVTVIQLTGTEGSLLTSSIISLYATYLAFSAVSKNPDGACNPHLGSNDVGGIVIGLLLTFLSLAWTGWSYTAEDRLSGIESIESASPVTPKAPPKGSAGDANLDVPFLDPEDTVTTGVVVEEDMTSSSRSSSSGSELWKLNLVLALISCWIAASLTGWGTIEGAIGVDGESEHTAANPTVGKVNMIMIAVSQWFALALYGWTLLAPRLFPDRDFS
eukprot:CAMPEP_0185729610 /NCGR_PEP_ID=MMETSP1171-20130828/6546_1 /TAXON_ID=374046 /ORGANISM="Helicotheca tamensis, Strain CCMP826" /LENGTH=430 /DNA_ID=CAMNT_0028398489 /DNA_START=237 /DNA_END=1529 /DNA_ORIENTATION=-